MRGLEGRSRRLRPAPRVRKRAHQLKPEPLAIRMLRDERLQLGDDLCESRTGEISLDPILKRGQIELFEPKDLLRRERLEPELRQRLAAP